MPSRPVAYRFAVSVSLLLATTLVTGAGCLRRLKHMGQHSAAEPKPPSRAPVAKAGPTAPKIDYAAVRPNELGRIPVLMYHEIRAVPGKTPLTRSVAEFKQDLETLYAAGFRPVNLSDVVGDRIDVPAGKSPVVLTFDDARPSQFKLDESAAALKIDPDCAMGILDQFHKDHLDWPMRATFFVLPKSKKTLEPFGQTGMGNDKLDYIVSNGMEIGNHTTFHPSLRSMTPEQIQQEIGNANNVLMAASPKAKITVMAVPMGKFPHNKAYWKYLRQGTYQGIPYNYDAVMDAAWRPMPSPDDKHYNANRLERIDATAPAPYSVKDWIEKLTTGTVQRYVSDGDPNVISYPRGEADELNAAKVKAEGKLANPYSPFGGMGGTKPIISGASTAVPNVPDAGKPFISGAMADAPPPALAAPAGGQKPISGVGK